jgi:autotransporter-associated beta strand protein
LVLNCDNPVLGGLQGNRHLDLTGAAIAVGYNNANTAYSGSLIAASLTKVGIGTLTLTGANSLPGGATLAGGALSVASEANLGGLATPVTFAGGTLQVTGTALGNLDSHPVNWGTFNGGFDIADAANSFSVRQAISGVGSLTKTGPGTLVLAGANTFSGGTVITEGTLQVGDGTWVANNGALRGDMVNNANLRFAVAASSTQTFSGNLSGSGDLLKAGAGTLVLAGAANSTGVSTVQDGVLAVPAGAAFTSFGPLAVEERATLELRGGTVQAPAGLTINTRAEVSGAGILRAGHITHAPGQAPSGPGIFDFGKMTFSGPSEVHGDVWIEGDSSSGVAVTGGATLTFYDAVSVHRNGAGPQKPEIRAEAGSRIVYLGTLEGELNLAGGGTHSIHGGLANDVAINSSLEFNMAADYTFAKNITGNGSVTQNGPGVLTLSGANDYAGGTVVSRGTLLFAAESAVPIGQALTIGPGATVVLQPGLSADVAIGAASAFAQISNRPMLVEALDGQWGATPTSTPLSSSVPATSFSAASVPEPGTLYLLAAAGLCLLGSRRLAAGFLPTVSIRFSRRGFFLTLLPTRAQSRASRAGQ